MRRNGFGAGAPEGSDDPDELYTEVKGTTCYLNGERGQVVLIKHAAGARVGAFVRLDERPVMLYAHLGRVTGDRGQYNEVLEAREIDRDEFDRLTGLAEVRHSMGWTFNEQEQAA